ncbi:MAG: glycosyltransferase family 2 protein [Cyclobacteriaceae bacterium]
MIIKTVAISICTYKRPNQLRQAIRSVKGLSIPEDLSARLVIINNFPSKEVEKVFREETKDLEISAEYLEEERRGIVFARNSALSQAKKNKSDYIAFFDDDDYPDGKWLQNLWFCLQEYSATVVSGRMIYRWPESCALSEEVKRIYDNALGSMKTGHRRKKSSTGNTLFDLHFVDQHNLKFHPSFNLTGGEDSHFFESMNMLGAKIVWCNEALVYSDIVVNRANDEFVFRRRYNIGYTLHRSDALLHGRAPALWKSLLICLDLSVRIIGSFFTFKPNKAKRRKRMSEAKGRFDSIIGVQFENYKE